MSNFKFLKFSSFFFVLAFVLFSHNISLAQEEGAEENISKVEIQDVKITPTADKLEVSATLFNPSDKVEVPPSVYLLMLEEVNPLIKSKSGILPQGMIVVAKEEKLNYSLNPLEKRFLSLSLPFSPSFPKENYNLTLRILSDNGKEYGYYEDVIFDLGGNKKQNNLFKEAFLAFDQESCVIMTADGEKYKTNEGPIFNPGESPKINCSIKNVGDKEITVYPVVEWKEFFVYGRPSTGIKSQKKLEQEIWFLPGETKNVALSLYGTDNPQVYQSLLSFIDAKNENRSFAMPFRWTVGGNSARVDKVMLINPLKNIYSKGETISLSVDYFGSMDLYWKGIKEGVKDLENLKIIAVIKDKEGNVCGTSEFKLPDVKDGYSNSQKIDITLDKKCENISYNISLFSDDKKLAENSEILPKVAKEKISAYYFYGLGLIFIIIIFFLRKFRKNKSISAQTMIFLAVFAAALGWFSLTHSETIVTYPDDNGRVIRGETVNGGTASTYYWGGKWKGGTLWLKASRGSGNERQANFSIRGYDGNEVNANFSNYFNNDEKIKVSTHFKYAFSGCSNEIMYIRARMIFKTDDGEDYINFRPYGGGNFDKYEDFTVSANTGTVLGSKSYEIQGSEVSRLYDNAKALKKNPKVILEYTMIMDNTSAGQTASKLVIFGTEGRNTINDTFNLSDVINIEIPLNLPAPSVSLSANPTTVIYPTKDTALTWSSTDVSNCTASSPVFNDWTKSKSNSGNETITNIWTGSKGLTADETHDFTLTCSRQIGGSTYNYATSTSVLAKAPPLIPLTIKRTAGGGAGSVKIEFSNNPAFPPPFVPIIVGENKDNGWRFKVASYFADVAEASGKELSMFNDKLAFILSPSPCPLGGSSSSCSTSVPPVYVRLTAMPTDTSTYNGGWDYCPAPVTTTTTTGDTCVFPISSPTTVIAKFSLKTTGLSVSCSASPSSVTTGSNVTFTATVSGGKTSYAYTWSGADSLSGSGSTVTKSYSTTGTKNAKITVKDSSIPQQTAEDTCTVTVTGGGGGGCPSCDGDGGSSSSSALSKTYTITISKSGAGFGSVSMGNVSCSKDSVETGNCRGVFSEGKNVSISATPDSSSVFGGWSDNGCSGEGICSITMDNNKTVDIKFDLLSSSSSSEGGWQGGSGACSDQFSRRTKNTGQTGSITINFAPELNTATPVSGVSDTYEVNSGKLANLSWEASANTVCCDRGGGEGKDNNWISWSAAERARTSGWYATNAFQDSTENSRIYSMACYNDDSVNYKSVSLRNPFWQPPPPPAGIFMYAEPNPVEYGASTTVYWSYSNPGGNQGGYAMSPTDYYFRDPNLYKDYADRNVCWTFICYLGDGKWDMISSFCSEALGCRDQIGMGVGYYRMIGVGAYAYGTKFLTASTTYKVSGWGGGYEWPTPVIRAEVRVVVLPPADFKISSSKNSLTATTVDGLSANSDSATLIINNISNPARSIEVSLSSTLASGFSGVSVFSYGGTDYNNSAAVSLAAGESKNVNFKLKSIPGATIAGNYGITINSSGGDTQKTTPITVKVNKINTEWQEF